MASRQRSPRRPAQRPDQILDAAERLLVDSAADWTMDALAATAGLGKGTLYHYYAAKSEVLDALRQRYLDRSVHRAHAAAESPDHALRRLAAFIQTLLADAGANHALVWALFHDTGPAGNTDLAVVSDALRDLIRDGVARGDLTIDNADGVATFFTHGFFGRIHEALHGNGAEPATLAAELTGLLERLVSPSPRASSPGLSSDPVP